MENSAASSTSRTSLRSPALRFESREIDPRHGTIHVPIVDLNRDGKLDFVALISQEHERVVAFLGNGDGTFTPEDLYIAPHPHWGERHPSAGLRR